MTRSLPYRLTTAAGESLDIDFTLHEETRSAVDVARLLSAVLHTVDRELSIAGETANGDVLQALAMALAARARLVSWPHSRTAPIVRELLEVALASTASPAPPAGPVGHA